MSVLISCLLPAFFFAFNMANLSVFCLCFLEALFSREMPQSVVNTETNSVYFLHYHFNPTGSMKFSFHSDSPELRSFFF